MNVFVVPVHCCCSIHFCGYPKYIFSDALNCTFNIAQVAFWVNQNGNFADKIMRKIEKHQNPELELSWKKTAKFR